MSAGTLDKAVADLHSVSAEPTPTAPSGLTSDEAARRLTECGPNEPAPPRRLSAVVELAHLFANPLVLILLIASAVAGWLGQDVDAGIIVTIVLLSVTVTFWQSFRSQQAAERLRASVAPMATARRDGTWQERPVRELVPWRPLGRISSWSKSRSGGYSGSPAPVSALRVIRYA